MIQYQLTLAFLSDKIEVMKTFIKMLLPLLIISMFASCNSTKVEDTSGNVYREKKQKTEKLLFNDWKYKGFGQELSVWFEPAFKNDISGINKIIPQLFDSEIVIIRGEGINSDQAVRNMEQTGSELSSDYLLYDSGWARIDSGEYIALALYYKKS